VPCTPRHFADFVPLYVTVCPAAIYVDPELTAQRSGTPIGKDCAATGDDQSSEIAVKPAI
jgi:hypothetical protein